MQIESVKFVRAEDRDVGAALFVNGQVVAEVNYDSYGTHGEALLEEMAGRLGAITDIRPEYAEVSDEEFREMTSR